MKHTIFDNELDLMMEAADALFCPQEGCMDDRAAYQTIFHMVKMLKERGW